VLREQLGDTRVTGLPGTRQRLEQTGIPAGAEAFAGHGSWRRRDQVVVEPLGENSCRHPAGIAVARQKVCHAWLSDQEGFRGRWVVAREGVEGVVLDGGDAAALAAAGSDVRADRVDAQTLRLLVLDEQAFGALDGCRQPSP
jgi:hypothetical protein